MRLTVWHAALAASVTTHTAALGLGSAMWSAAPAAPPAGTTVAQHLRLTVVAASGPSTPQAPLVAPAPPDPRPHVSPDPLSDPLVPVAPNAAPATPLALSVHPAEPARTPAPMPMRRRPRSAAAMEVVLPGGDAQVAVSASGATPRAVPARPVAGYNPPPPYPRVAHRNGWSGTVLLDVQVTRDGGVTDVRVARSSGHRVLDRAAAAAVGRWRFTPARAGPLRYAAAVRVPIVFRLEDAE